MPNLAYFEMPQTDQHTPADYVSLLLDIQGAYNDTLQPECKKLFFLLHRLTRRFATDDKNVARWQRKFDAILNNEGTVTTESFIASLSDTQKDNIPSLLEVFNSYDERGVFTGAHSSRAPFSPQNISTP